jgi:hypothetical protein
MHLLNEAAGAAEVAAEAALITLSLAGVGIAADITRSREVEGIGNRPTGSLPAATPIEAMGIAAHRHAARTATANMPRTDPRTLAERMAIVPQTTTAM